ncbi:MAG: CHASE2 domain-containing protein [Thainema sp.]
MEPGLTSSHRIVLPVASVAAVYCTVPAVQVLQPSIAPSYCVSLVTETRPDPTPVRTPLLTNTVTQKVSKPWWSRFSFGQVTVAMIGGWTLLATYATGFNIGLAQLLERQVHTLFFNVRGVVEPPSDIVILAIDEESLGQEQFYAADPEGQADLAPIAAWPWQRTAYARVIERLMEAEASAIALDIILDTPSTYGEADDAQLTQTLERYGDRVVLAADLVGDDNLLSQFGEVESSSPTSGVKTQVGLVSPQEPWRSLAHNGLLDTPVEVDGRIHQLGQIAIARFALRNPASYEALQDATTIPDTFAAATLAAAQREHEPPTGTSIFFYGGRNTFTYVPFWMALDPKAWQDESQLREIFADKIVLVGATAPSLQDIHDTPFGPMPGVEVQANAIATLMDNRSIGAALPAVWLEGLLVLVTLSGFGYGIVRSRQPLYQFGWTFGACVLWYAVGYGVFVLGSLTLPVAVPSTAIALIGISHITISAIREQIRKQQLRQTLKQYAALPIVQEIISQQDDLRDLLLEREAAIFGKILGGRYRVVKVLGTGGFSETYIAEDTQRPSNPPCVVKRLRLMSDQPNMLKLMRRLFIVEAESLERLGQHSQIPQLLAYFEEDQEFYLVQELIVGRSLHGELALRGVLPPESAVQILVDLLPVVEFVHNQQVIHRDIKPVNIIRRGADAKLVLIDFGIAKRISHQVAESDPTTKFTIGLGTKGYMPSEQAAGMPQFNSDLYALGMTVIEALTGLRPSQLPLDNMGNSRWEDQVPTISPEFKALLNKMVHYNFAQRYQTVRDVMAALETLPELLQSAMPATLLADSGVMNIQDIIENSDQDLEEASSETQIWDEE